MTSLKAKPSRSHITGTALMKLITAEPEIARQVASGEMSGHFMA